MFCKGSQCFDRPDYRMSTICPTKLWKTLFCPRYVSLLKKHRLIVLFTSDAMYKKYKWLDYISPDLLARFRQVNLSNKKKFVLIFYFGLPFRQRNATYKLQMCQSANLLWSCKSHYGSWLMEDDCYFLGFHVRLLTRCKICSTLGLSANYFSIKSFCLSLKSYMNVP